jgi:hypothetical protein
MAHERPGLPDHDPFGGDSDGYQSDSDSDSNGYRSDSHGDSDGYHPDDIDQYDEGLHPLIEVYKSMREGWWNQAGYETYWDLVKEEEAGWERMGWGHRFKNKQKRPVASDLPDAAPADIDLDAVAADAAQPRRPRCRQVNVRLTELGYDALREAARSYGVRPTTLARLLIHRGAIAVLEQQNQPREKD